MVPVAVAMIAGIVAGRYLPLTEEAWAAWAAIAIVVGVAALVRRRMDRGRVAVVPLGVEAAEAARGGEPGAVGSPNERHVGSTAPRRGPGIVAAVAAAVAVFALSAVHVRVAYFRLPNDEIATYAGHGRQMATIRGRIAETPSVYRTAGALDYPRQPTTVFALEASGILTATGWQSVSGVVQVSVQQEDRRLEHGQEVELVGRLARPLGPQNPGQRDMVASSRIAERLAEFRVPLAEGVTILSPGSPFPPRRWIDQAGTWAGRHLGACAPGRAGMLLEALITGRRDPELRPVQLIMSRNGTAHLLSISGQNLAIFLGFVYLLCRLATLGPRRAALAALVCLAAYLPLVEPNSPVMRSAVMAASLCIAQVVYRRSVALNALAVAAVVLLLADPLDLFTAGFQLSFGIVAGILLFTRPVRSLLFGRWVRTRGLIVFRDQDRLRRWLYFTAADWAMEGAAMSLVAWVVSAPLGIWHFGIFSLWGAPLTVLESPLMVAATVPGYLSLVLGWAAPNLSAWLGWAAGQAAEWFLRLTDASASLPWLGFDMRPVTAWWVILAYGVVAVVAFQQRIRRGRAVAILAAGLLVAATIYTQRPADPPDRAELNLLAVGAGQCAVLRTPSGRTYIFDAGSLGRDRCGDEILVPFLLDQRLAHPTAAAVSHANTDHYNALPALLHRGWLNAVWLNDYFGQEAADLGNGDRHRPGEKRAGSEPVPISDPDADDDPPAGGPPAAVRGAPVPRKAAPANAKRASTAGSPAPLPAGSAVGELMVAIHEAGLIPLRLRAGAKLRLDDRTTVEVLWPPAGRPGLSANDTSLVLRLTCDGQRVLLPGDVDRQGESTLAAACPLLAADVLVLPHHGAWRDTLPAFVNAVGPKLVLASTAREPSAPQSGGQAARLFYQRLTGDYEFHSTLRDGWIQVRFGRGGYQVRTMRR